ncbi:MAG: hypothetical protein LBI37_02830 [Puniceicoccales bacterium]|nr:hypothetical protein [Puniceicoccales bacterium]
MEFIYKINILTLSSAFGDALTFELPNSKLILRTTFKKFIRPDKSKINDDQQLVDYDVPAKAAVEKFISIVSEKLHNGDKTP